MHNDKKNKENKKNDCSRIKKKRLKKAGKEVDGDINLNNNRMQPK